MPSNNKYLLIIHKPHSPKSNSDNSVTNGRSF